MPDFFGTRNFKTFQRNLNLWYVSCSVCLFVIIVCFDARLCSCYFSQVSLLRYFLFSSIRFNSLHFTSAGALRVSRKARPRTCAAIPCF
jgi:hypothetical protein